MLYLPQLFLYLLSAHRLGRPFAQGGKFALGGEQRALEKVDRYDGRRAPEQFSAVQRSMAQCSVRTVYDSDGALVIEGRRLISDEKAYKVQSIKYKVDCRRLIWDEKAYKV